MRVWEQISFTLHVTLFAVLASCVWGLKTRVERLENPQELYLVSEDGRSHIALRAADGYARIAVYTDGTSESPALLWSNDSSSFAGVREASE